MKIPHYKRVPINAAYLMECVREQGYSDHKLAKKIGVSASTVYSIWSDSTINPALLNEIAKIVPVDIAKVMPDIIIERVRNGRSTSGRLGTDWVYLERSAKKKGYSMTELSLMLGKGRSYLYGCKRVGGLSLDIITRLAEILEVDPYFLITSYDKHLLRKEIREMVDDIEF